VSPLDLESLRAALDDGEAWKCPHCAGSGRTRMEGARPPGARGPKLGPCPHCKGSGKR
jgi:DnaJ-class molecular chaperone